MIKSLRWQLLLWLLIPLMALLAINSVMTYRSALAAANAAYDRTLLASARAIAEGVTITNSDLNVDLPYAALDMLESSMRDRIFYRVSLADGKLLTGYPDLPLPAAQAMRQYQPIVYEARYRGERIRVAALAKPLYDPQFAGPVLIQVAETLESRWALTREVLFDAALRQAGLIVLAALLVWLGVQWGLRPLLRLSREIVERKHTDLTPIEEGRISTEVRPLVTALNVYLARLKSLISAQQRFIADASHQLKTPLTLLNTQAEFALRQENPAAMQSVIRDLHKNTHQVVRLANQLLMLARAEPGSGAPYDCAPVQLNALARSVCLEWSPVAVKKQVDLGFDGEEHSLVLGDRVLLRELIANLVDNAVRYTPPHGIVTVSVGNGSDGAWLEVEDNGPGIPPEERHRVFDRFYRVLGAPADGSGLGLAIVREICRPHGAEIELCDPAGGMGLRVRVSFPPAPEGALDVAPKPVLSGVEGAA